MGNPEKAQRTRQFYRETCGHVFESLGYKEQAKKAIDLILGNDGIKASIEKLGDSDFDQKIIDSTTRFFPSIPDSKAVKALLITFMSGFGQNTVARYLYSSRKRYFFSGN